ncbi:general secretion pathway protein GspK [Paucibacter sp. DJ2R-2]|uniref:general secretion pathway protein GspK n=1 Tax=Paucibacter sp. DJ2R-2 TaxID=2893558 RepID=UPI0021E4C72A|nr:general secretion pathway protein GspK [Paucibacter sp. DJ2R-2]MCV2423122.1 general secretion pathway protein GspK [Paucibacter sp. DJ4R-1]MCV2441017.1 general secretion pathway protein GspK [Paucibacter sp. DJ2R-2]
MVIASLAVIAFVALRFAERIDQLRSNAVAFTSYATAKSQAASAQAAALYWLATRPVLPSGRGEGAAYLRADGRWYAMPTGARISVQDQRGLLSLNAPNRQVLLSLLIQDGLDVELAQAHLDVLEDYIDTDDLRRLNGAEQSDYAAKGLNPPRNDWMLSVHELESMPLWRDDRDRLRRLVPVFTVAVSKIFNPNTASPEALRAVFGGNSQQQLELLLELRKADLLRNGAEAARATGLPLDRDDNLLFFPGRDFRLTTWAPGMPRSLEYNVRLSPSAASGPWIITEQHSASRPSQHNEPFAAPPFPLSLAAGESPFSPSPFAP